MEDKDRMDRFDARLVTIGERLDRLTVEFEKNQHASELRFRKMEEMQLVLMDSQNRTWEAINRLTENIDRLSRGPGSNGHDRPE